MGANGYRNFYWGFLFIMLDFRIQGIDILPDIIGYLFFAAGFNAYALRSIYFNKARSLNIPMIFLSIFTIYEKPIQGGGIHFGPLGPIGVLIGIAAIILNLLIVYNLFMGVKEMAGQRENLGISTEAEERWTQYLYLQIAVIAGFILIFIPLLAVIYFITLFIVSIMLLVKIMGFMKKCEESLY